jgi:hypothetical protein
MQMSPAQCTPLPITRSARYSVSIPSCNKTVENAQGCVLRLLYKCMSAGRSCGRACRRCCTAAWCCQCIRAALPGLQLCGDDSWHPAACADTAQRGMIMFCHNGSILVRYRSCLLGMRLEWQDVAPAATVPCVLGQVSRSICIMVQTICLLGAARPLWR